MNDFADLRIRSFAEADYDALAELIRATHVHDAIPWLPTSDQLRLEMTEASGIDPGRDVHLAELDGRLVGAAGVERTVRDGVGTYETWGHVLPGYRRRGIGQRLMTLNLANIDARVAAEPVATPVQAGGFAEEQEIGHRALLEGHGFEPVRHFFLMRRPNLEAIPEASMPEGLAIREVTPDQHRVIFDAEAEAFRDHWNHLEVGDDHFRTTFANAELDTDLWAVAWDGDQVAGVVQTWVWAEENRGLGVKRGWLEHISVRRPWRRRGLARALTADALRRLRAAGMDEAMLGVDSESPTGALGLYEALGFEVHGRSLAYHLDLPRTAPGL